MERWNILRNYVGFYNTVAVSATYTIPRSLLGASSTEALEALIFKALEETLNHQPIMGVVIEDEGSQEPKWARLEKINLRDVVRIINVNPELGMDDWVSNAHRVRLDRVDELPLWRVVVAAEEAAITRKNLESLSFSVGFFSHHAIADGLSNGAFHLTFLDALNAHISSGTQIPTDITHEAIITPPKVPLLSNLELATPLPIGILFLLKQLFVNYVYAPVDPLNWSGPLISAEMPRPVISNLHSFSLPTDIVDALRSQCRREKTTVTALVSVLIARRLAEMYPTYLRFSSTIPFSLRKFTGHSARDMGCWVSGVKPHFSSEMNPPNGYISCRSEASNSGAGDELLWASARQVKKFITDNTSTFHDQDVGLLKHVSDFPKLFYGKFGTKRQNSFEVTNIGLLDGGVIGDKDKAYFDKAMLSTAQCTYAEPYTFCLTTVKNGDMTVALCWATGVIDDDEALGISSWLDGALRGLAGV
jgi:hypothetical protein